MNLESPEALFALAGMPLVVAVFVYELRRTRRSLALLTGKPAEAACRRRCTAVWAASVVFFCLFCLAAVVAVAGPSWGERAEPIDRKGLDIVFVVDVSRSMRVDDAQGERLERAVAVIRAVADRFPGARCGLVAFSTQARRLVPISGDRVAFSAALARLPGLEVPADGLMGTGPAGSRVGPALDVALASFLRASGRNETIVLVSDGEFGAAPSGELLASSRRRGVPIHAVAVGSVEGGQVNGAGGKPLTGADGRPAVSRRDDAALRDIAAATRGHAFDASRSAVAEELGAELEAWRTQGENGGFRIVEVERTGLFAALALFNLGGFFAVRAVRWRKA